MLQIMTLPDRERFLDLVDHSRGSVLLRLPDHTDCDLKTYPVARQMLRMLEPAAEGVTLTGLQYPLMDARLTPDVGLAVSNHFLAEQAVITVRKGALLVGWQLPSL